MLGENISTFSYFGQRPFASRERVRNFPVTVMCPSTRRSIPWFSRSFLSALCTLLSLAALSACAEAPKHYVRPTGETPGSSGAAGASDGSSSGLGIELNGAPQYY